MSSPPSMGPRGATVGTTLKDEDGRRYTLQAELGRGTQAAVFAARASGGQAVAIKLFWDAGNPSNLARAAALMRQVQQTRVALPATVPLALIRHGQHQGYVTDLIDGQNLGPMLEHGQSLSYFEGVRMLAALWSALAQLHAHGIAHGDVRPENIMLTDQGIVLIDIDNFVLQGPGAMDGVPQPGMVGDLCMMAPELRAAHLQQRPASPHISTASDVYAAVALSNLMLLGDDDNGNCQSVAEMHQLRMQGWNADPMVAGQHSNLTPAMLPLRLMSLIRQGWHPDPALRPEAAEFAQVLGQILAEGTLMACGACHQPLFADALQHQCPHCGKPLPVPVLKGPQLSLPVPGGAITVGRQELGGDPSVSSKHAVLQRLGPCLRFTDRSTYGASQRDRGQGWEPIPATAVVLHAGEKLRLGNTVLEVGHA